MFEKHGARFSEAASALGDGRATMIDGDKSDLG